MGHFLMLIETIKNVFYFGLGLLGASFAFMYSDGGGFLFYLGWVIGGAITILFAFNLFSNGMSLILGLATIPLYFDGETDKKEKLILDFSNIVTVIFDVLVLLAGFQLLQQYGGLGLDPFEPFGIQFFHNFSY